MFDTLKSLFGMGPKHNFAALVKEGAVVVDVRSSVEFANGHIKSAINIPVENLNSHLSKLPNKNKTIITCCASGIRSGMAKNILSSNGYTNVLNGGGWKSLNNKILNN
jgi:phage shock protein E